MSQEFIYVLISLGFSAFFAGIEIAFVSVDKLQIAVKDGDDDLSNRLVNKFINNPSNFIGTTLIGLTIAQVVYGIYIAEILEPIITVYLPVAINNDIMVMFTQTILSTIIVLATAEFLPKSLFLVNPNLMLNIFAIPMQLFYYLLWLPVTIVIGLTKLVISKFLGEKFSESNPAFGLTDLNNYIQTQMQLETKGQEVKSEIDTKILSNALDFKHSKVRDCMIPRTEIVAIEVEDGLEELKKIFIESGHSKVLIYSDSIDNIIGYCHSKELFKKPESIHEIMSSIPMVAESLPASDLLVKFIDERKSIAVILDEFGGTSGIVTLEDIMEEIFGEINDEHDENESSIQQLDEHNWLINARLEIDLLNETLGWDIPKGDYETLGGYIISIKEDIPDIDEIIDNKPFTFTIISKDDARLDKVKVTYLQESETNI
ncbi:MAG: hypothetical protein RLZZ175_1776 [Bacteroidota bacterium]|jgi:putative hemolysin